MAELRRWERFAAGGALDDHRLHDQVVLGLSEREMMDKDYTYDQLSRLRERQVRTGLRAGRLAIGKLATGITNVLSREEPRPDRGWEAQNTGAPIADQLAHEANIYLMDREGTPDQKTQPDATEATKRMV